MSASEPPSPSPPVSVRIDLAPDAGLLGLVQLTARLYPGKLRVEHADALRAQPVTVRCDGEVPAEAVWRAMVAALESRAWTLERDAAGVVVPKAPAEPHRPASDRAVDLVSFDRPARDVARWFGAQVDDEMVETGIHQIVYRAAGNTLIVGGYERTVAEYRPALDTIRANPDLLDAPSRLYCGNAVGRPLPGPGTEGSEANVGLTYPPGTTLWPMTRFACDVGGFAVIVPLDAEDDRVTVWCDALVTPRDAHTVYELALALHGWTLEPDTAIPMLVRSGSPLPGGEVPVLAILAVDDVPRAVAMLEGADDLRVVPGRDGGALFLGGPEGAVARAREVLGPLTSPRTCVRGG